MSKYNPNSFTPCAMCKIRACSKNRNKDIKDERPLIEKLKEEADFKKFGCPEKLK